MIEAVGHDYLPGYFGAFDEPLGSKIFVAFRSRCLKPGGKVAIQAICVPDERYETYRPAVVEFVTLSSFCAKSNMFKSVKAFLRLMHRYLVDPIVGPTCTFIIHSSISSY